MALLRKPWFLSLLSGILLFLSWPVLPFPFLIFIAFVPLLLLEDLYYKNPGTSRPFRYYIFGTMLLWNLCTTWWIWNASPAGAVAAVLINALLQSLPWLGFHLTRKTFGDKLAYPSLVFYWIAMEYLHFNWDFSWPWLTLGNVFAQHPDWVQWYEYTGASGGSLWIWMVNIGLFKAIQHRSYLRLSRPAFWLVAAFVFSWYCLHRYQTNAGKTPSPSAEILVVQPNIDPYTDKFEGMDPMSQVEVMIGLSNATKTDSTRLVLWPETSLTENLVEDRFDQFQTYQRVQEWIDSNPRFTLISGASTYRIYEEGEKLSPTARKSRYGDYFYDAYNSALLFEAGQPTKIYHKSKLVPGVEMMPYPQIFGFLESLAINLGGTSGSLGTNNRAEVFDTKAGKAAPIICYESVYGDYVTEYVRGGASILAIITNDGWWQNTPGYKQHFHYGRLRAIENRRYIARSANTGISGFIAPDGHIMQQSAWWTETALREKVPVSSETTFFSQSGDYIGKTMAALAVLIFLSTLVKRKTRKGY